MKISEFEAGKKVEGMYFLKNLALKVANSNSKRYFDITLSDASGEINGKIWEVDDKLIEEIQSGRVVKVRGTIIDWQGNKQFKVEKIRNVSEDEYNIEDFIMTAPLSSEDMLNEIYEYVEKIENSEMKKLVTEIISEKKEKLMYYPAAKSNHHAIRGGLLYHTLTMLKSGEAISSVYKELNKDLIFAGCIVHDFEKISEMDSNEVGIVDKYTREGTLLGHITIGVSNIEKIGTKLNIDKEIITLLQHIVLSHHYEPEYGSPVKPMIPEAEIVHYLDIIDARLYDINSATKKTKPGEFSERIWSLENRRIYRPINI